MVIDVNKVMAGTWQIKSKSITLLSILLLHDYSRFNFKANNLMIFA